MTSKVILRILMPCFVLFFSTFSYAAEVTLAWDPSAGGAQGYRIYYGTTQGAYSENVDVGNVTVYTLSGLQADVAYYFVTRAYNDEGESGNSNEVSWIYETADTTPPVLSISGPASTADPVINLSGTASDDSGVAGVTWINDQGGDGNAQGTSDWTISGISLSEGPNIITVSAIDAAGNIGTAQIQVTYTYIPPAETVEVEFGNAVNSDHGNTIQDTFINSGAPATNYSTDSQNIILYTWPDNTSANNILIKWDLSAIPSGAKIQNATLHLYQSGLLGDGKDDLYEVSVHKIINHDPDISKCTWANYDGANPWTGGANGGLNDVAAAEDIQMVDKSIGYKQWDVTQMVQDWVADPASNFGMILASDQGANKASTGTNRVFVPTENADVNKRPKLIVTFSAAAEIDPPPSAPTGIRVVSVQ